MKNIFSNNMFIIVYYFLVGLLGLYTKTFFKKLIKKHNIFNVMFIEAVIGLLVLLPIAFYLMYNSKFQYLKILKKITRKEISYLFLLSVAVFSIPFAMR